MDGFIDSIIDQHIEKKGKGRRRKRRNDAAELVEEGDTADMVDELLAFYRQEKADKLKEEEEEEEEDMQNSINLTRDNIKAIIMVSNYVFCLI